MARYFTADTHFGHANIIRYCDRPFLSVAEMNDAILSRFHDVVADTDELWVLGDLAMGSLDESLAAATQLPGIKHLVVGNHDRTFGLEASSDKFARAAARYEAAGFELHHGTVPIALGAFAAIMNHFPYAGDSHDEDRYIEARPADEGLPLIHGHIHDVRRVDGRMFNVGVDVNDFRPVAEAELAEWVASL